MSKGDRFEGSLPAGQLDSDAIGKRRCLLYCVGDSAAPCLPSTSQRLGLTP
jgi:hypothetical protein